ncbi:MAG TPA: hypothetical protein VMW35_18345 [Myxococcota bacterium]|nr:hypothetical protein [Myxococcota bacterium]
MHRRRAAAALAAAWMAVSVDARAETIELAPHGRADFGLKSVGAPFASLVTGPGYWYDKRKIEVDTSPPGAALDLFYVRANFQKRYEQTTAPATVVLPSRVDAGPRDSITIRAYLEGHKIQDVTLPATSAGQKIMIDLSPLPNRLDGVSHTYLAGRSELSLLTKQVPSVRLQEREGGITVVLNETASSPEATAAMQGIASPLIASISGQQLGEDLLLRIEWTAQAKASKPEIRSRTGDDPGRGLHVFSLDVSGGATGGTREAAIAAIARIGPADVGGCALVFDAALRDALDPEGLARALAPKGSFTDPILRATMRRLGEVSPGGQVASADGARYQPAVPLELEAALGEAASVKGYLAALRAFARDIDGDQWRSTFHGLVAPELGEPEFDAALAAAEAREKACRGR